MGGELQVQREGNSVFTACSWRRQFFRLSIERLLLDSSYYDGNGRRASLFL